jgi:hypothetical protein
MKNSSMYSYLLSKKIPLFGLYLGILYFLFFWYEKGKNFNLNYMFNFVCVWIGILIIIELHFSFVRTFDLMRYVTDKQVKKKVRFYLQILPYVPSVLGTLVVCLFNLLFQGILYPWVVIYMLAGTQLGNFIFVSVFNIRIEIASLIEMPEVSTN